jgi:hypothetical protein
MAKDRIDVKISSEARLKKKLRDMQRHSAKFTNIVETISGWSEMGWKPVIFGGFVRDLFVLGSRNYPRDVDVVITNKSNQEIEPNLNSWVKRRTSLGGFHLQKGKWNFDVWGLEDTWAFQQHPGLFSTPSDLPKTTFLDVEAIAVEILEGGRIGQIYQHGFFSAIEAMRVDLNWEENGNRPLAAVRALSIALKLKFTLGLRLAGYVLEVANSEGIQALIDAQVRHYGTVRLGQFVLVNLLGNIAAGISSGSDSVPLTLGSKQLNLWSELLQA